jgi:lipid II:glycine glycyltransferase (peptidoglycan interpeptide bridge formation enzyme)
MALGAGQVAGYAHTEDVTGRLAMREARSANRAEWDAWLERSPGGGHILQSHEWGEFKRTRGWTPIRLVLERDGDVVGAGQFLLYNTPLVPGKLMYAPKGPWLPWDDAEAVRTFFGGVRTVAEREGVHTVKIEPEVTEQQAEIKRLLGDIGFQKARYDLQFKTTMVVDLHPSEDELLARMKEKTRYNIRLAGRKGVEVAEDNSPEAHEAFYELMKLTAERDGFKLRPYSYNEAKWEAMSEAGRSHLFFATHEGEKLAGMLLYTFGTKYWYMTGASSNEKRNLMPTYLLQWEVMRWAKAQGITYYDMVAVPNPDNLREDDSLWGVYRFKAGFGGEIKEFLGVLDLPVRKVRASAWYRFEPVYYRAYRKLTGDVYY